MFQIVFNEISAAEISRLGTLEQLELLDEFKVTENDLDHLDGERFGKIERDGRTLHRFRARDWRFYFEVKEGVVIVHRVLHKGTFSDFAFRSKIPIANPPDTSFPALRTGPTAVSGASRRKQTPSSDAPVSQNKTAAIDGDAGKEQSARHHGAGGDFKVSLGKTDLTGTVRNGTDITETLGQITIEPGQHEIRVSATRITGEELMRLRRITLTPVAP